MGTLGQKLDYLTDTKSILKQKINNLGGSLTDQSTFRSYGDYLDELYDEMPKVTGEGTEITLTPTRKGRMQLDLKGNTSQDSTTGKNLFGITSVTGYTYANGLPTNPATIQINSYDANNISFELNYNAYRIVLTNTMQLQPNTNYILSYTRTNTLSESASARRYVYSVDSNNSYSALSILNSGDEGIKSVTFTTTDTGLVAFAWGYNNSASGSTSVVSNIQVELGSSATDYEPYTGGQPSPSPDYPQDIHVVTGNNTIEVQGKNLWGGKTFTTSQYGVDFTINIDGTVTANGTATINAVSGSINQYNNNQMYKTLSAGTYTVSKNSNKIQLQVYDTSANIIKSVTTTQDSVNFTLSNTTDVIVRILVPSGTSVNDTFKFQLEQGSTATDYVPYYHQDYPINLGNIEICKIGDYQDYLYKENGNWYIKKLIDKDILIDTDNWDINTSSTNYIVYRRTKATSLTNLTNGYCNYFIVTTQSSGIVNLGNVIRCGPGSNNVYYVVVQLSDYPNLNTLENWLSWLENHNIVFYGVLRTPTSTQITDTTLIEQLENISNAMSTTDTTNITQTNADLPFIISASALKPFTEQTLLTSLTSEE